MILNLNEKLHMIINSNGKNQYDNNGDVDDDDDDHHYKDIDNHSPAGDNEKIIEINKSTVNPKKEFIMNIQQKLLIYEIELLLEQGADVNSKDNENRTPLHKACIHNAIELVSLFIEWGADLNAADSFGTTALHYASMNNYIEIVEILLVNGVNVDAKTVFGTNSLHFSKTGELTKLLLDNGANVNAIDSCGVSSMHYASMNNLLDSAKILLEYNVNLMAKELCNGRTALHYACLYNSKDIVNLLLSNRNSQIADKLLTAGTITADTKMMNTNKTITTVHGKQQTQIEQQCDNCGKNAIDYALNNRSIDILTILLKYNVNINYNNETIKSFYKMDHSKNNNKSIITTRTTTTNESIINNNNNNNNHHIDLQLNGKSESDNKNIHRDNNNDDVDVAVDDDDGDEEHSNEIQLKNQQIDVQHKIFQLISLEMIRQNLNNNNNNREMIMKIPEYSENLYLNEIHLMEKLKIGHSKITFLNLLFKKSKIVAKYLRNQLIRNCIFSSRDYLHHLFPLYGPVIEMKVKKCENIRFLIDSAINTIERISFRNDIKNTTDNYNHNNNNNNNNNKLPIVVIDKIIDFLSIDQLKCICC